MVTFRFLSAPNHPLGEQDPQGFSRPQGLTPLHRSAENSHVELSQILVGAGANIHATDNYGETPLHRSARQGHVDVSQMLVGAGANIHAATRHGTTPLDNARVHGDSALVAFLQQSTAEPLTKSAAQGW
mmetsp:Transcript_51480/g.111926  ORF Transcript_51480/g.111926 Transcript_51480/m.111926 type:complete len:129 (+) Transcript_51480:374-760(+)